MKLLQCKMWPTAFIDNKLVKWCLRIELHLVIAVFFLGKKQTSTTNKKQNIWICLVFSIKNYIYFLIQHSIQGTKCVTSLMILLLGCQVNVVDKIRTSYNLIKDKTLSERCIKSVSLQLVTIWVMLDQHNSISLYCRSNITPPSGNEGYTLNRF